jgi:hypothetical protein
MLALRHETSLSSRSRNHHLACDFSPRIHRFLYGHTSYGGGASVAKGFGFDSVGRASRSLCGGAEPIKGVFQASQLAFWLMIFVVSQGHYR